MKKPVYALICALLAAVLAVTALAAQTAEMKMEVVKKTVAPGETVAFTVSLAAMEDCRSAGFTLFYDKTVFEFSGGSCSAKNTLISSVKEGTGVLTFGDPVPVSGEIFAFRLKVKDDAPAGSYTISAKGNVRNADGAVTTKINDVTLTVESIVKTTEPTVAETLPVKQTEPAVSEATEPAVSEETEPSKVTEPADDETKPVKDMQFAEPETPVHTIGAEPEGHLKGFLWWGLAVVVVIAIGGIGFASIRKKK